MAERLACKAVGLARSTHRRLPLAQTPTDPDAEMLAWLRSYANKHQPTITGLGYPSRIKPCPPFGGASNHPWQEKSFSLLLIGIAEAAW
jgi:hypothetical protein